MGLRHSDELACYSSAGKVIQHFCLQCGPRKVWCVVCVQCEYMCVGGGVYVWCMYVCACVGSVRCVCEWCGMCVV